MTSRPRHFRNWTEARASISQVPVSASIKWTSFLLSSRIMGAALICAGDSWDGRKCSRSKSKTATIFGHVPSYRPPAGRLEGIRILWLRRRRAPSNLRSSDRPGQGRGKLPCRSRFCGSIIPTISAPERSRFSKALSPLRSQRDIVIPWRRSPSSWRTRVWTTSSLSSSNVQTLASSSRHRRALAWLAYRKSWAPSSGTS
jgi:hypothetical protein